MSSYNPIFVQVKGKISIEKCAEQLRSSHPRTRHHALVDLLSACRSSYNCRQCVLSLQDGHPVLWHLVYKEWTTSLAQFTSSMLNKPAPPGADTAPVNKPETVKPSCRPLATPIPVEKQTHLYSLKDATPAQTLPVTASNSSKISALITGIAGDALISFKKNAKEFFLNSRVGKCYPALS